MTSSLPVLVVAVPLLGALVASVLAVRFRGVAWPIATLCLGFSCAGSIRLLWLVHHGETIRYALGGWAAPAGIEYAVDGLNGIVLVMVATLGFLTCIWMRPTLAKELKSAARDGYVVILLLFATGSLGITITADIFNLYVFLEIASITSYVLVGLGRRRSALYAGYTYLVLGSIGATFILLGIGHLYMATGSLSMADISGILPGIYDSSVVRTAFAFLTVGLAIKMALFPLHGWQPGAYTYAPSSASLFMAATATKVAAYAYFRMVFTVFGPAFLIVVLPDLRDVVMVMALTAIVVGPLLAVRQGDMKRLLAYSSVGQIGYIALGVVLLNEDGVTGSIAHFWNHAAAKGALFCVAGTLVYATRRSRVEDLAGLGRTAPFTAVVLTVAGCSMIGIPFTGGFLSKFYLATGAIQADHVLVVPALLISSVLTAVYVWRMLQLAWFSPADTTPPVTEEVPWAMRVPALVLAAACLVFGMSTLSIELAREAARALLG